MSNIPEGATHKADHFFYRITEFTAQVWSNDRWCGISYDNGFIASLIPLKPTKWIPEVGEECEYQDPTGQGIVRLPPDSNGVLIVEESGSYKRVAASECKPIKTEREKFIDSALLDVGISDPQEELIELLETLFEKGYHKKD